MLGPPGAKAALMVAGFDEQEATALSQTELTSMEIFTSIPWGKGHIILEALTKRPLEQRYHISVGKAMRLDAVAAWASRRSDAGLPIEGNLQP